VVPRATNKIGQSQTTDAPIFRQTFAPPPPLMPTDIGGPLDGARH
jgi:hypothetical protein